MITKLRKRIESEKGFTLIEMLIVIIILGILLAIAVPAYLSFRDRANNSAAQGNIRAALPAIEAYNADHNGYAGMTAAALQTQYDAAIKSGTAFNVKTATSAPDTYCVEATSGSKQYHKTQASDIVVNLCP